MSKMVGLRFSGGASLTFQDATGARQRVERGVRFETDEDTAKLLMATDPGVARADDDGPTVISADEASPVSDSGSHSWAYESIGDIAGMKVDELRGKLSEVGLDTAGKKQELADRLTAFQAGFEAGTKNAATLTAEQWALMSPSPGAPLDVSPSAPEPNSSEAEPGAPPPPEGGLTAENEAHNTGTPTEGSQVGDDTGAISVADLGDGGATK